MIELDPIRRKQIERMDEFATFGLSPRFGPWCGTITLLAGDAEKVLRMLRRLEKLERVNERKTTSVLNTL